MIQCFLLMISFNFLWSVPQPNNSLEVQVAESLRNTRFVAAEKIRVKGTRAKNILEEMAFDKNHSMNTRWKSFMVFVEVEKENSLPAITRALNDSTWFMRSAGLTALNSINQRLAHKWSYKILQKDPALMVRMKAFEILKDSKDSQVNNLFWRKIFSEDSQHKSKSLIIRGDMARALLQNPKQEDRGRWIKLLHENDRELQMIATQALQILSPKDLKDKNEVSYWKQRYPESKSL